jgi:hypothetical protein
MRDSLAQDDKSIVPDKRFLDEQKELKKELEDYLSSKVTFTPFYENMKEINRWLKEELK